MIKYIDATCFCIVTLLSVGYKKYYPNKNIYGFVLYSVMVLHLISLEFGKEHAVIEEIILQWLKQTLCTDFNYGR